MTVPIAVPVTAYRLPAALAGGTTGSGSLEDGAKHATVMLTITYLVLTLLG